MASERTTGSTTLRLLVGSGYRREPSAMPSDSQIAHALYDAQSTPSVPARKSLDEILFLAQQSSGWTQVFKQLKSEGLIEEQTLGHVTHFHNLQRSVRGHADVSATWLPIPFTEFPAARVLPPLRNWSVRASLRARRSLDRALAASPHDALVFHTQVTALLRDPRELVRNFSCHERRFCPTAAVTPGDAAAPGEASRGEGRVHGCTPLAADPCRAGGSRRRPRRARRRGVGDTVTVRGPVGPAGARRRDGGGEPERSTVDGRRDLVPVRRRPAGGDAARRADGRLTTRDVRAVPAKRRQPDQAATSGRRHAGRDGGARGGHPACAGHPPGVSDRHAHPARRVLQPVRPGRRRSQAGCGSKRPTGRSAPATVRWCVAPRSTWSWRRSAGSSTSTDWRATASPSSADGAGSRDGPPTASVSSGR